VRTLFLSDLHSNLEATRACLEAARGVGYDRVAVLGDLVGYGGSPEEVVNEIRSLRPTVIIRGNHDRVVAGIEEGEDFNLLALQAALTNRRMLSEEGRTYLRALPAGPRVLEVTCLVSHGTPLDEDEYLVDPEGAEAVFREVEFSLCFFGHTHVPCVFRWTEGQVTGLVPAPEGTRISLRKESRYLINPGSVGQPRDEDPRASFLTLDSEQRTVTFHRVHYPIQEAQLRILEAGLPPLLAQRLQRGV
jgi:diadenosine tetraphosphatase ApaH/serine/threonine PP2A family protein phosphatase